MDGDGICDWDEIVFVFKHHGWAWSGDWPSFKDKPHFAKTFGLSTAMPATATVPATLWKAMM